MSRTPARVFAVTILSCWLGASARAADPAVTLKDTPGQHLDVLVDGKVAARYMYAYDKSSPERLNETYKPYLHVYDADGAAPITKGPGGLYPHHRGIYVGWNKIKVGDRTLDRWHMKGGEIVHQKFLEQKADNGYATFTAVNDWNDEAGKPFMTEERTVYVRPAGQAGGRLVIDVTSTFNTTGGEVTLGGDPEHAGVHFRPANDIDTQQTVYVYPKENAQPKKDVDYPWVGESFTLKGTGKRYSVVQVSHPKNPTNTRWSAYRNYGRFGAFPVGTVKPGVPLTFRYRFVIADGEMPPADAIMKHWGEFGEVFAPVPAPAITTLPADQPRPRTPAAEPAKEPAKEPAREPAKEQGGKSEGGAAKPQAAGGEQAPAPFDDEAIARTGTGLPPHAAASATTGPATTRAATTAPANFKGHPSNAGPVDAPIVFDVPPPEPLPVEAAMKTFALPEGLRLEPVASEPMVETPVAISFDERGRMYVVEMRSYMQNVDGDREQEPIGRVKRLTDTDGDGRMDKSELFLDGLVMPRAVLAARGGALVAEPPVLALWEDTDDDGKADKKTVVSTEYGNRGGQPEHMANTPTLALDNWIYSSNHALRYRFVRDRWVIEPTSRRGQWGMTQDDYGRLYYSTNSDVARGEPLHGQYFSRNPFFSSRASQNVKLMTTQEVWPSHPTPGVNRGYTPGQLREDGTLRTATAAGGGAIYRGDLLPGDFVGNLFTPEPSGNLVKRMIVKESNGRLSATNAYEGKDFLTSTDERFRPVQVCTGPDGALYVVDMYQGVLQHRYFLTHYLIKNIKRRQLESPIHWGRIYRVVPDHGAVARAGAAAETPVALAPPRAGDASPARGGASATGGAAVALLSGGPAEWVKALGHPNGWVRDTAQRLLVERNDGATAPALRKVAREGATPLARIHALWTLEGMRRLDDVTARAALRDPEPKVRAAAVRAAEPLLLPATREMVLPAMLQLAKDPAADVQLQLVLSLGAIPHPAIDQLVTDLVTGSAADPDLMREAALSGLRGRELEFAERLLERPEWTSESEARAATLTALAGCVIRERRSARVGRLLDLVAAEPEGSWRQGALLRGMAAPAADPRARSSPRVGKLIYLDAQPEVLPALLASNDTDVRELAQRVDARLAWPGKPGVPPPPVVTPLPPAEQARFERGRDVYTLTCAACHQPSGMGMEGLAPPLVDSEWVLGPPQRLARIVLHGLTGAITVNGAVFTGEMPALPTMTDADIAAALTYVRREWEHAADPVDEQTVRNVREATQDRTEMWTAKELLDLK